MSKLLSELKYDGEMWVDSHEVSHQDRLCYVLSQFNFCGCGVPESAAQYIRDGLQAFVTLWAVIRTTPAMSADASAAWASFYAHWPDEGARYFFWYWLDVQELTEHGGSVPGWLTDKGLDYLAALNEALADENPDEVAAPTTAQGGG